MELTASETTPASAARTRGAALVAVGTAGLALATVALMWAVNAEHVPAGTDFHLPWVALAIGFAGTEVRAFNLRFRSESYSCTLTELVLVIGLFGISPNGLLSAQLVGVLFVLLFVSRKPLRRAAFNLAQIGFTTAIAILVFDSIAVDHDPLSPRTWIAVLCGVLALLLSGFVSVFFAVTVTRGRPSGSEFLRSAAVGGLWTLVSSMVGLVIVIQYDKSPAAVLLLIAPVATVFLAYRAYISERTKSDALQFLYSASETLNRERDLETGLLALLEFARESFGADLAEIVLRGEPGEQFGFRTAAGPASASSRLEPVAIGTVSQFIETASRVETTEFLPAPDSELAVRKGMRIGSSLIAPLQDESGIRGALLLSRGVEEDRFDSGSIRLFETFAIHLGLSLEKERLTSSLARLRKAEQELAYQAYHDSLTGLANRALFRDRVDAAIAESQHDGSRIGVVFIDLDDFKAINDTKGHAAGDALLTEVGIRLARSVGNRDTAARIGGDEFALLLRDVAHASQVHLIAHSIIRSLREPIEIDGESHVTQASIGVALHGDDSDAAELMQQADVAMYHAKREGKGRYVEFREDMSRSVARRHELKAGLERAVTDHEFTLEYQPVMDTASGEVTGAEALLRWSDPNRGLQQPDDFVGVAEETGLIVPIGRIVVQAACRQAVEWVGEFSNLRVFVNISARELAHPDIVRDVSMALAMSNLDPRHLVLEVTETAMMQDVDEARERLLELKKLGIGLAIDDFGTGFSSLSYLREFPFDVLKIAKPIVDGICDSAQDTAFVRGIVELGHVVGAKVVAEGVERDEQHAQVIAAGADFAQGYYYAPPMAAEELTRMLRTSKEARELFGRLNA